MYRLWDGSDICFRCRVKPVAHVETKLKQNRNKISFVSSCFIEIILFHRFVSSVRTRETKPKQNKMFQHK
jgi:hypothetical protein